MVEPIVYAAAPVVQSATDDDGIINKLFKIGMLVGFLLLAAFAFFILNVVIDIADIVGAAGLTFTTIAGTLPGFSGLTALITLGTGLFSAFGFGGRN